MGVWVGVHVIYNLITSHESHYISPYPLAGVVCCWQVWCVTVFPQYSTHVRVYSFGECDCQQVH